VDMNQRSFDVRIIDVPHPVRVVPRLGM
jgi:hypothetical protein